MSESLAYTGDFASADVRTPRQKYLARMRQLERAAQPFVCDYQELADHYWPGSVRLTQADKARTRYTGTDVVNSVGILARRTMQAGIASSLTSPARPWAALGLPDLDLMRWGPVKTWLHLVTESMFRVFARSNLYQVLPTMYAAEGVFGTAAMVIDDDPKDLVRFYQWTTGTYYLAANARQTIDTGFRRFQMSVANLIERFGVGAVSSRVKKLADQKNWDQLVDVVRVIEPNWQRDTNKIDAAGMAYTSTYFESGGNDDKLLEQRGLRDLALIAPRWEPLGEDEYGRGLGFQSLPDSRQLQFYGRRNGQATDGLVQPAVASSAALEGSYPLPGEIVKTQTTGPQSELRAVYAVPPAAIQVLDAKEARLERRLNELWFVDLWLALTRDENRPANVTAREVAERHEEKLLQLGPVLVQQYNELLDPTIERTFNLQVRRSTPFWMRGETGPYFPPPPEEIHGMPLRVEYISPLAVAQKLVGIAADERLASTVGNIYAVYPQIVKKINWFKFVEGYAERVSANPDIIVPQDQVDAQLAAEAKAAQQQQQTEQLPAVAKSAQVLSQTDVGGDSALNRLLYAQAGGAGVPPVLPGAGRGG
jgi:hypothetical protein